MNQLLRSYFEDAQLTLRQDVNVESVHKFHEIVVVQSYLNGDAARNAGLWFNAVDGNFVQQKIYSNTQNGKTYEISACEEGEVYKYEIGTLSRDPPAVASTPIIIAETSVLSAPA